MTNKNAQDDRQHMSHADMQVLCAQNPELSSGLPLGATNTEVEDFEEADNLPQPVAIMTRFPDDQQASQMYTPVRPAWLMSMPPVGTRLYTQEQLEEAIQQHDSQRENDRMSPEWKGGYSMGFEVAKRMLGNNVQSELTDNFRITLNTQCQDLISCVESMREIGKYQPQIDMLMQVVGELQRVTTEAT